MKNVDLTNECSFCENVVNHFRILGDTLTITLININTPLLHILYGCSKI
jgi:hypothetical protein